MMTNPMPKSGADHGSPGQGSPDHASARPVCVEFSLRLMNRSSRRRRQSGMADEPLPWNRATGLYPCGGVMALESLSGGHRSLTW